MVDSLCCDSICRQIDLIRERQISSTELLKSYLKRIDEINPKINAYLTIDVDGALRRAEEIDKALCSGDFIGPLSGIPIAVKDNICTSDMSTSCASNILNSFIPPYDAFVTKKLVDAGAIILGKSNMDEFAMGSSTETSAFGPTVNPWSKIRVSGGSSGGSAAIVAADLASGALGSDTGGSIRQPAAFCSVVGMKPTYGRVSRYGLIAYASSLDQIGPLTKDVKDCALLLSVISGKDNRDSTCVDVDVPDYMGLLGEDVKGIRIGKPKEYFIGGLDTEVADHVEETINILERLGAQIKEVSLPHTEYAIAAYYLIATAEASSNLARYDGVQYGLRSADHKDLKDMYFMTRKEGFGQEVKRRIMLGTYALSSGYYDAYYIKALKVRSLIKGDFDQVFSDFDIIITPTTPTPAFKIGENVSDPLKMYLNDIFTISANLAGIPAVSIPCGFTADGLPIGVQILGKAFNEAMVLKVAFAIERAISFQKPKRFWEK